MFSKKPTTYYKKKKAPVDPAEPASDELHTTTIARSAKIIMANAIKSAIIEPSIILFEYPIIPEYTDKSLHNCVLDFADIILNEYPYNGRSEPLDYSSLFENVKETYISHLKSYMGKEQYGLNNEWVPSSKATYPKNIRSTAIIDCIVITDDTVEEMWLITPNITGIKERIAKILEVGYKNTPIYYIHPQWVIDNKTLDPSALYTEACKLASQLNPNLHNNGNTVMLRDRKAGESDIHLNAKLIFASHIDDARINKIPCLEYPLFNNYNVILLDTMIEDFASVILRYNPYNKSKVPPVTNKMSKTEYHEYIQHLKSYGCQKQYDLNNLWVPNKFIAQFYATKLEAIVDIAITDGISITELWEIKHTCGVSEEKLNKINNAGCSHIPIYEIDAAWIIENQYENNLYDLAKEAAKKFNC